MPVARVLRVRAGVLYCYLDAQIAFAVFLVFLWVGIKCCGSFLPWVLWSIVDRFGQDDGICDIIHLRGCIVADQHVVAVRKSGFLAAQVIFHTSDRQAVRQHQQQIADDAPHQKPAKHFCQAFCALLHVFHGLPSRAYFLISSSQKAAVLSQLYLARTLSGGATGRAAKASRSTS